MQKYSIQTITKFTNGPFEKSPRLLTVFRLFPLLLFS